MCFVIGRSDWVSVRNTGMLVRRRHPQLANSLESRWSNIPAAGYPRSPLRLWFAAVDRQLRSPRRIRVWLPVLIRDVAVRAVPQASRQDHQRVCVYVCVCLSVCPADRPVLRESAIRVSQLPVFQLHPVCARILSQHGGGYLSLT